MGIIKPCQIIFADDKVEKEFNVLKDSEDIKKQINRAKEDIKKKCFLQNPNSKKINSEGIHTKIWNN